MIVAAQVYQAQDAEKEGKDVPSTAVIIFLFMNGGSSQVNTFDPKPGLVKWEGKRLPV